MAWSFSVNNTPATGSIATYQLITQLVSAGWSKVADSDGTTYSSGGTQVTSGASGTNGLGNTSAWVKMQAPNDNGQQREFIFQRGSSGALWRVKYSAGNGFTGGTPSATQVPSATDEVIVCGGGTDASPTYASYYATDNTYRWHIITGGASEGYSWFAWAMTTSTTSGASLAFMDRLLTDSTAVGDTDPCVVGFNVSSSMISSFTNTDYANNKAWFGDRTVPANSRTLGIYTYSTALGGSVTLGSNPFTGKDDLLPVPWIRNSVTKSWKGFSTLFKWTSVLRTTMDTYDVAGTRDYIQVSYAVLPWDGSVPVI